MTDEEVSEIIISLVEQGVPTTIVAKAFNVDTLTIKNLQADLRINKYGSSEIAELLQGLMFIAYEEALKSIRTGTPPVRARMVSLVLSKGLALVGRQSPEEFERLRSELGGLLSSMQEKKNSNAPSMYADPTYSPSDVEVDDDTSA